MFAKFVFQCRRLNENVVFETSLLSRAVQTWKPIRRGSVVKPKEGKGSLQIFAAAKRINRITPARRRPPEP